jgi:protein-tyrosine-phosphatase
MDRKNTLRARSSRTYYQNTVNVLFVCEDNAALSIMAEAILRAVAPNRFAAHSAGCFPGGAVNAYALEFLAQHHMPIAGLRSKSLQGFRSSADAKVDFIITLGDVAADEDFSGWPGEPFVAHWNVGDDALRDNFWTLMRRIKIFTSLPHGKLSRRRLEQRALRLEPGYL